MHILCMFHVGNFQRHFRGLQYIERYPLASARWQVCVLTSRIGPTYRDQFKVSAIFLAEATLHYRAWAVIHNYFIIFCTRSARSIIEYYKENLRYLIILIRCRNKRDYSLVVHENEPCKFAIQENGSLATISECTFRKRLC